MRDLVNHKYQGSQRIDRMSMYARAAQFSPFAALSGYDDLIAETSRLTDERTDISEDSAEHINECLRIILESYPRRIRAKITYFVPDSKKQGGSYRVIEGFVRQIDVGEMKVVFEDGRAVLIKDIFDVILN